MNISTNEHGLVLEIEHHEIDTVVAAASTAGAGVGGVLGPVLAVAGVSVPIAGAIIAGVGAYIGAEAWLIKNVDKGNGVYLTMPWLALYTGSFWLIIPTTRPVQTPLPPPRWSDQDTGTFGTRDAADRIDYTVHRGTITPDMVTFRLFVGPNSSGWKKAIDMPDGEGNSWQIEAEGRGGFAENSLWAHQPNNGQVLTFIKAKSFGFMEPVLELGDLAGLRGGDLVEFHWNVD